MESKPNVSIPQMLFHLDKLYDKQEEMEKQIKQLYKDYAQVKEDIEMAQTILMYHSNKKARKG